MRRNITCFVLLVLLLSPILLVKTSPQQTFALYSNEIDYDLSGSLIDDLASDAGETLERVTDPADLSQYSTVIVLGGHEAYTDAFMPENLAEDYLNDTEKSLIISTENLSILKVVEDPFGGDPDQRLIIFAGNDRYDTAGAIGAMGNQDREAESGPPREEPEELEMEEIIGGDVLMLPEDVYMNLTLLPPGSNLTQEQIDWLSGNSSNSNHSHNSSDSDGGSCYLVWIGSSTLMPKTETKGQEDGKMTLEWIHGPGPDHLIDIVSPNGKNCLAGFHSKSKSLSGFDIERLNVICVCNGKKVDIEVKGTVYAEIMYRGHASVYTKTGPWCVFWTNRAEALAAEGAIGTINAYKVVDCKGSAQSGTDVVREISLGLGLEPKKATASIGSKETTHVKTGKKDRAVQGQGSKTVDTPTTVVLSSGGTADATANARGWADAAAWMKSYYIVMVAKSATAPEECERRNFGWRYIVRGYKGEEFQSALEAIKNILRTIGGFSEEEIQHYFPEDP